MNEFESKVSIACSAGNQEVSIGPDMYRRAQEAGLSFAQWFNSHVADVDLTVGTPFQQAMRNCGMVLTENHHYGTRVPTMQQILNGTVQLSAGAIARPDGSQSRTPAGRIFFPAVMLEVIESSLRDDRAGYNGIFQSMVYTTSSISSPKYEQVIVDHTNPRAARGQPISQFDRPVQMLTLRTTDISRTMPTYSIGLEISEQALQAVTLDIVGLALREQALEERSAIIDRDLVAMVNGDTDSNYTALSSITAQSLDAGVTTAGTITQRAWVKYLRRNWRLRSLTHIICDVDTYLAIEGRANRPVKEHEPAQDERLNVTPTVLNTGLPGGIQFFLTEDSLLGANTLVGLDSTKAIRRVVYTGADYRASEEFVMRRTQALRIDWSERYERAGYDQAWSKMTLTV